MRVKEKFTLASLRSWILLRLHPVPASGDTGKRGVSLNLKVLLDFYLKGLVSEGCFQMNTHRPRGREQVDFKAQSSYCAGEGSAYLLCLHAVQWKIHT